MTGEQNEERLNMMMVQLYGAVLMPVIMYSCGQPDDEGESAPFGHLPPFDDQVDHLFDHYFHKYEN